MSDAGTSECIILHLKWEEDKRVSFGGCVLARRQNKASDREPGIKEIIVLSISVL